LPSQLDSIERNQAVAWGVCKHKTTKVVKQSQEANNPDAISRTGKYYSFPKGKPDVMMLDNDTGLNTAEFVAIIEAVMPGLQGVARIERPSCSSDIYDNAGHLLTTKGTGRVYYLADDGSQIPSIGKILHQQLILADHGFIQITKSGSMLVRSPVDACVWQAERLDFVADPVLGAGLERRAPKAKYVDGPALVAADVQDLTDEEELRLDRIVNGLKAVAKPEADKVKALYIGDEADKLVKSRKVPKAEAVTIVKQRTAGNLIDGDVLHFDDLGTVSVAEVLCDPVKYDLESLSDPLEPDYDGGRCKAMFFANDRKPKIHSFAHGSKVYHLGTPFDTDLLPTQDKADFINSKIKALAHLEPVALDIERKELMKKYGIKAKTIDEVLANVRAETNEDTTSIVNDVEAWHQKVNGADLLHKISSLIATFTILPSLMYDVLALWVLLTYCYDNYRILPQVAIYSPEKRCGKSTLMEVVEAVAHRALFASNISPAAVYRSIEKYHPTLFIDEADTFYKENLELQGICNSGHTKRTAYVIRTEGDNHDPVKFSTWCPKVIALIGELKDTQHDRSIIIQMRRRLPDEVVKKLPTDLERDCTDIRQKCKRWTTDNETALKLAKPKVPETGNDREQDNWTPLFAIAECVGGDWPGRVKKALLSIAEEPDDNESLALRLLRDIQGVFIETTKDKIVSEDLVTLLKSVKDAPWNDWNYGRGLTQNSLGRQLKPFKVKPQQQWIYGKNLRGYSLDQFKDTFERYLSAPTPPNQSARVLEPNDCADFSAFQSAREVFSLALQKHEKPVARLSSSTLAVENGGARGNNAETKKAVNSNYEEF
ncbi:DUF3631 domain-containing protein, partial [bacterium]|nr:DUF3631 domain-containing protein [bacterium]